MTMSFPLGAYPIGGFPDADSASIPDPLVGLLSDPSVEREFLLRAAPLSGGSPVDVDLSSGGYTSASTDSPFKLFPGAIGRPYNFTASLPIPDLRGGSSLGVGELRVNNPDGYRDAEALHDWLGVTADVYVGKRSDPLTSFTRFFRGRAAGVTWGLDSFSVLHRDLRFRLQRPLQTHRYGGFGACVRCNGSTSYGAMTQACPANSMTLMARARPTASAASTAFITNFRNGSGAAGVRGFIIGNAVTNQPGFTVRNDAGTAYTANGGALTVGVTSHLAGVLDTAAGKIRLYINGALAAETAIAGTFATVLSNFEIGRAGGSATNFFAGDIDEPRIYSTALTVDQILADMDRELLGTESGLVSYHKLNEGSGTTAANAVGGAASLTLTNCTWVGSLEGDAATAGVLKPLLFGKRRQITPVLVDSQRLVYQWHDGSSEALAAVRDGGDDYTFGADLADIYSATPSAGTYNTSLAKGLFRLGSSPVGVITCDGQGDDAGALGYVATAGKIHRKIATQYGGLTDPDELDATSYSALEVLTSATVGHYFTEAINVDAAMDEVISGACCWWSPDRTARCVVGRIDDPATATPTVNITQDDVADPAFGGAFERQPAGVRVGQVVLGYRPYQTTLSAEQVAGAVSLTERDDFAKEYRYVTATDPDRTDDADTMTVYTDLDDLEAAQTEADRLLALWMVDRSIYTVALDQGILAHFIGTIFEWTYPRYDLTGGKHFVAVGVDEDMGEHGAPDRLGVTFFG